MSSLVEHHSAVRDRNPMQDALQRAKQTLGTKWLLHPANRVKKLTKPYGERR